MQFDAIYSSDLLRAIMTADILTDKCSAKRMVVKEFREIDIGELEKNHGTTYPEKKRAKERTT